LRLGAADFLRADIFAAGRFIALARFAGLRFVVVVAMGPPLLSQANHLQAERITGDSAAQGARSRGKLGGADRGGENGH
jgi:hypothetical protein